MGRSSVVMRTWGGSHPSRDLHWWTPLLLCRVSSTSPISRVIERSGSMPSFDVIVTSGTLPFHKHSNARNIEFPAPAILGTFSRFMRFLGLYSR
ncbi:hypothetical protein CEXT_531791 [Caerostris extrusa]|uniref:Secreted protein n=1 Tax=Caerostris extrusa TaxID=172846 RepID=A0AAV4MXC5_CAEEX|nr:hypothetical protein CEXT_531791 [Caerostris extrusa]